jgi:hypothetical protein
MRLKNMCSIMSTGAEPGPPGAAGLVIRIAIDTTDPLTGSASAERGGSVPFVGWLELLRAVSELVGQRAEGSRAADEEPPERAAGTAGEQDPSKERGDA